MVFPPVITYGKRDAVGEWVLPGIGIGALLCAVAAYLGIWWLPVAVGGALGLIFGRRGLWPAALAGAIGWALALVWMQVHAAIWPVAGVLSGILGLGNNGAIGMAVTLLLAALLGVCGAWVGTAARGLALQIRRGAG
jgi:hypothetical protein